MKNARQSSGDGVGAASALLKLVHEFSPEDFEAAEAILGAQRELSHVLQVLRIFKEKHDVTARPPSGEQERAASPTLGPENLGAPSGKLLSVDDLKKLVRDELIALPLDTEDMAQIAGTLLGRVLRTPPNFNLENTVDQAITILEEEFISPAERVTVLVKLLRVIARVAGRDSEARVESVLLDFTIQALTRNTLVFPAPFDLANARTRWAPTVLPHKPDEPRHRIAARLFKDAERVAPEKLPEITLALLKEGLRSPADAGTTMLRRASRNKANGK